MTQTGNTNSTQREVGLPIMKTSHASLPNIDLTLIQ